MFSTLCLPSIVTMSTACVRRAARLVRALAGIYLARPDWLLTVVMTEGNPCVTGTQSWSPSNRTLGRGTTRTSYSLFQTIFSSPELCSG